MSLDPHPAAAVVPRCVLTPAQCADWRALDHTEPGPYPAPGTLVGPAWDGAAQVATLARTVATLAAAARCPCLAHAPAPLGGR